MAARAGDARSARRDPKRTPRAGGDRVHSQINTQIKTKSFLASVTKVGAGALLSSIFDNHIIQTCYYLSKVSLQFILLTTTCKAPQWTRSLSMCKQYRRAWLNTDTARGLALTVKWELPPKPQLRSPLWGSLKMLTMHNFGTSALESLYMRASRSAVLVASYGQKYPCHMLSHRWLCYITALAHYHLSSLELFHGCSGAIDHTLEMLTCFACAAFLAIAMQCLELPASSPIATELYPAAD